MAGARVVMRFLLLVAVVVASATVCAAQLRRNHYAGVCPDVETIVRGAVAKKFQQTFITVGALVHLYFHDCFVEGCDASVLIASTANNTAEKDSSANLSLAGDGFDAVIKAKAALDAVPRCRNQVSCADILTMATRDAIALAGGPAYAVELGRLDGLSSTAASVPGKLAPPSSTLDKLTALFASNGLSQTDMIALSGGHTVGLAHCSTFASRLRPTVDPTLSPKFAAQLQSWCPPNVDARTKIIRLGSMESRAATLDGGDGVDLAAGGGRRCCKQWASVMWEVRGSGRGLGVEVAPLGLRPDLKMAAAPPFGGHLTSLTPDLSLVAGGCGQKLALDWGKPLADGGSHDVDDVAGVV